MGSLRLTVCTGAVVAAALTPTSYAAASTGVGVSPASPAPGSDIRLAARGCDGRTGTAASDAFVADTPLVGKDGVLVGESRVRTLLAPGSYDVLISCDGRDDKVRAALTVAGASPATPAEAPTAPLSPAAPLSSAVPPSPAAPLSPVEPLSSVAPLSSAAPASPVAPVNAGGGGTAHLASEKARETGAGNVLVGLALAGIAACAVRGAARRNRGTN
ncbi:hypothetical protein AQJ43_25550 [Streptomyces avermitilis]|uniref:Secreted protein n=2 Tax=Streptomyces avermitilis TaxID=33903 RepID=Q82CX3_STRAW|nr:MULTISPECIES: hypothetical protein [Streptomyces]KUN51797.1 hypothetical protein AQJ43_25550 [Streptomyces avermitilis]MYT00801.1 hypothetical protein [Streptomyces sp. SID5469]OOV30449.1 hypothetical protein SM007_14455 [Streptomyces avermitilis]BAC72927.1 hypothetical protein SAVERM_5215 [Streptomyces avermitilis MA-4680 = NBRC 14893]BBJ53334.1 hypothetical protein SAVMC3_59630 [Streptomyces avermitilis]